MCNLKLFNLAYIRSVFCRCQMFNRLRLINLHTIRLFTTDTNLCDFLSRRDGGVNYTHV